MIHSYNPDVQLKGTIIGYQNGITWTLAPWSDNNQIYQFKSSVGHVSKTYRSLSKATSDMIKEMKKRAKMRLQPL